MPKNNSFFFSLSKQLTQECVVVTSMELVFTDSVFWYGKILFLFCKWFYRTHCHKEPTKTNKMTKSPTQHRNVAVQRRCCWENKLFLFYLLSLFPGNLKTNIVDIWNYSAFQFLVILIKIILHKHCKERENKVKKQA